LNFFLNNNLFYFFIILFFLEIFYRIFVKPAIQLGDTKAENQSRVCRMVCVFLWGQISLILQNYFEKNLGKCVFKCKMCFFQCKNVFSSKENTIATQLQSQNFNLFYKQNWCDVLCVVKLRSMTMKGPSTVQWISVVNGQFGIPAAASAYK